MIIFFVVIVVIIIFVGITNKLIRNLIIILIVVPVVLVVLFMAIADYKFFKGDAIEYLKTDNIDIDNNFSISSHHIYNDFHGGCEEFTLELSDDNKKKIIQQIKYSPYYLGSFVTWPTFQNKTGNDTLNQAIRDFQIDSTYVRENNEKTPSKSTRETISICGRTLTMIIE